MRTTLRAAIVAVLLALVVSLAIPAGAASWHYEVLDGDTAVGLRTDNDVGNRNATLLYQGLPHVFYYDETAGDVKHGWWTGSQWLYERLDGNSTVGGSTTRDVGQNLVAAIVGGTPHVWYHDRTAGDLRHMWWTGSSWGREILDGDTEAGDRTDNHVGAELAVTIFRGAPHVFYSDFTADDVKHAYWTGISWAYDRIDGNGTTNGRTTNSVGGGITATVFGNGPHVWYQDATARDLRHAYWTGTEWRAETLDGDGAGPGRTHHWVAVSAIASTVYQGYPHVWYLDVDDLDLRHAWWTGSFWAYEVLDGNSNVDGRVTDAVGVENIVTLYRGAPHVFYGNATKSDLRHGFWTGSRWVFETLDGDAARPGRTSHSVYSYKSVVQFAGGPHLFYADFNAGHLRHAWYG